MRNVYIVSEQGSKPMVFTLAGENMTKRGANILARSLRNQGHKAAVFTGNVAESCF